MNVNWKRVVEILAFCCRNIDSAVGSWRKEGKFNQWTDQSAGRGHSMLAMIHRRSKTDSVNAVVTHMNSMSDWFNQGEILADGGNELKNTMRVGRPIKRMMYCYFLEGKVS